MCKTAGGLALLASLSLAIPAAAGQTGLLVVAHGATAEWNRQVRETVAQVRWQQGPVSTAFLMGPEAATAGWNQAMAELVAGGAKSVVVVPLLVSSYGSHYRQIQFYAGLLDEIPPELAEHDHAAPGPPPLPMRVTAALDTAPELHEAVGVRWSELGGSLQTAPLILLGHGPNSDADAARWIHAMEQALAMVGGRGHRGDRRPALMRDDAPPPVRAEAIRQLRDSVNALAARSGDSVTVMTVLIARGQMTSVRIPRDLDGLPIRYAPAGLTPLPVIARWIERVAGEAAKTDY
jgi:sirohydrochlorin cobaltochelatase